MDADKVVWGLAAALVPIGFEPFITDTAGSLASVALAAAGVIVGLGLVSTGLRS